jgi:lysophospholipase L1-like esterase
MPKRIIGSLFIAVSLVVTGLVTGPAQKVDAAGSSPYYVALGDSLAQGVQPNAAGQSVPTNQGYVDDLYAVERGRVGGLLLNKLGCPGETTTTMINGGVCTYPSGSQLAEAAAFIHTHRVALVTIDIGANNIDGCIVGGIVDLGCIKAGLAAAATDLPVILSTLRAAGPRVRIFAMNYYDPFLAAWLQGPAGQLLAKQSVLLAHLFNGLLTTIYQAFAVRVVGVAHAFHTDNFARIPVINLPINVTLICAWTWMCAAAPRGPNIHANVFGYAVIASTFAEAIN